MALIKAVQDAQYEYVIKFFIFKTEKDQHLDLLAEFLNSPTQMAMGHAARTTEERYWRGVHVTRSETEEGF